MIFHMNHQQKGNCYFILVYDNGDRLRTRCFGAPEYVLRFQYVGKNGLIDVEFYDDHKYTKRIYFKELIPVLVNT